MGKTPWIPSNESLHFKQHGVLQYLIYVCAAFTLRHDELCLGEGLLRTFKIIMIIIKKKKKPKFPLTLKNQSKRKKTNLCGNGCSVRTRKIIIFSFFGRLCCLSQQFCLNHVLSCLISCHLTLSQQSEAAGDNMRAEMRSNLNDPCGQIAFFFLFCFLTVSQYSECDYLQDIRNIIDHPNSHCCFKPCTLSA